MSWMSRQPPGHRKFVLWGPLALASLTLLALARTVPLASEPAPAQSPPLSVRTERTFMRGMTVSCPDWGQIWGSPAMAESLRELQQLGVSWIALHPYAGVRRDGSIHFSPAAQTGYLARAVVMARAVGLNLFWNPHLAYWGSFEWRGEITFGDDDAAWQRFFSGYRAFIVDQARFAQQAGVPLFSVGIEYENTTARPEWREIIAAVRQVYHGRLTYAANWDRIHAVPFWDALDLIGVQAYFPLSSDPNPDPAQLERGWDAPLAALRELSRREQKPVFFTEIGYDLSPIAAREPWRSVSADNAPNRALRQRLLTVALTRIEQQPFIVGMFWWKWIPGQNRSYDDDFSMRHPDAIASLRQAWQPGGPSAH